MTLWKDMHVSCMACSGEAPTIRKTALSQGFPRWNRRGKKLTPGMAAQGAPHILTLTVTGEKH